MARRRKSGSLVLAVIVILILGSAIGFFAYNMNTKSPVVTTADVTITIESGSGSSTISRQLYEAGLTRGEKTFRSYAKQANIDSQLQAGIYTFAAGEWSLQSIGLLLLEGDNNTVDYAITIPEGYTVAQMAELFAGTGQVTYAEFMDCASNADFNFDFIPDGDTVILPANRLEGYLAPDTYMISPSWGAYEIITMLLRQFDNIWTEEYQAQADNLGMSIHEVMTLASVIEKEAAVAADRPIISGVFHNRLKSEMMLQSCATIQFLLGEPKFPLLNSDLEIESPYNSYKYIGLPPGPIASPGRASIEAALWPTETTYLYFRARTDGSHRFSETYQEHMQMYEDDM